MLEDFRMATEIPQFMPLWIKKKIFYTLPVTLKPYQ